MKWVLGFGGLVAALGALVFGLGGAGGPLAGVAGSSGPDPNRATVRFRVILTLDVDGEQREFSNVHEITFVRYDRNSLLGFGGRTKTKGEALVVDLGERGRAYLLRASENPDHSIGGFLPYAVLRTLDLRNDFGSRVSTGSLMPHNMDELRAASGRHPFAGFEGMPSAFSGYGVEAWRRQDNWRPFMLAFEDEAVGDTVFEVPLDDMSRAFGPGVEFVNLEIEFTQAPVTEGEVARHLPWVVGPEEGFETETDLRNPVPREQMPLRHRLNNNHLL